MWYIISMKKDNMPSNRIIWVDYYTDQARHYDNFEELDRLSRMAIEEVNYWEKNIVGEYGYAETIIPLYMEQDRKDEEAVFCFKKTIKPIVITRPIIEVI